MSGEKIFPLAIYPYKFAKRIGLTDSQEMLEKFFKGGFAYVGICKTGGLLVAHEQDTELNRNFLIEIEGEPYLVRGKALLVSVGDAGFISPDEETVREFGERAYRG